jgi:epidermal growth factor receptor kinase substrate 8
MERFPAALIQEPTAFTSRDPMEMYNNILVFTVADDGGAGGQQRAEMHIFQCQSVSAQDLVEDLKMLQAGKLATAGSPRASRAHIPPPPALPPPEPPLNGVGTRDQIAGFNSSNSKSSCFCLFKRCELIGCVSGENTFAAKVEPLFTTRCYR